MQVFVKTLVFLALKKTSPVKQSVVNMQKSKPFPLCSDFRKVLGTMRQDEIYKIILEDHHIQLI